MERPVKHGEDVSMIELDNGSYRARILPEHGGMVAALDWRGPGGQVLPLLHAPEGARPGTGDTSKFGSWAMLPFANRAFDGIVDDGETRFVLPLDQAGNGPIHGYGWSSRWSVAEHGPTRLRLDHDREAGDGPYRYRAVQEIVLDGAGMTIALSVTNRADRALPFGLGHHPWFPCAPDTTLAMRNAGALILGERYRATGQRAFGDGGPYAKPRLVAGGDETAWSFLGWDGTARIETPSRGLAIVLTASESLRCPVVWAPAGADFLCVEPQSHAIGSPSERAAREAAPMRRLQPGESLEGWLRIAAEPLSQRKPGGEA